MFYFNELRFTIGSRMLIRRAGHGAGLEVHQAKTRESLDKKLD